MSADFSAVGPELEDLLDRLDFATIDELRTAAVTVAAIITTLADRGAKAILATFLDVLDQTAAQHNIVIDRELIGILDDDTI